MERLRAKDIMTTNPLVFNVGTPVVEAAKTLTEKKVGGAPVVDAEGKIVGIVSEGDLIMSDIKLHFPTYIQLLNGFIYLPSSLNRFEEELRKAVGARVEDVMTKDVVTTTPDASVEDVATLMVDRDVGRIPIIENGRIVGIITKGDIVKSLSSLSR